MFTENVTEKNHDAFVVKLTSVNLLCQLGLKDGCGILNDL